jgi:hypothetical protein
MSNLEIITNKDNDNNQDKMQFETFRDLMMYFQTSIRNVALTTAVSFAALGYSRFYRGKSKLYVSGMVLVSLLLLSCSFLLNLFLYDDIQKYINNPKYKAIEKWSNINKVFMVIHAFTIFFAIYTFYRVFTGKTF